MGTTDAHCRAKEQAYSAALMILVHYHQEGDNCFNQIVTGDETWVSHIIPESKH
jgi:metal-responsive CopG/Arc/MetJ family transcriptional regulator